jgi:hypothetical protein
VSLSCQRSNEQKCSKHCACSRNHGFTPFR